MVRYPRTWKWAYVIGREQPGKNAPNVWFPGTKNMRRTFDFLFYMSLWLQQMWVLCPTSTFKGEQDVLEGNRLGKMHQTYGFQDQKK
jgi:hypothetical protein